MSGSCGDKCLNPDRYSGNLVYDGGKATDCDLGLVGNGHYMPLNDLLLGIMNKLCDISEEAPPITYIPFNATIDYVSAGNYSTVVVGGISSYSYEWSLPGSDNSFLIVG